MALISGSAGSGGSLVGAETHRQLPHLVLRLPQG